MVVGFARKADRSRDATYCGSASAGSADGAGAILARRDTVGLHGVRACAPRTVRPEPCGTTWSRGALSSGVLARCPDFSDLGADALDALCAVATIGRFSTNDFIYLQDDEARYLYFVVSGHIRLSYLMEDGAAILHAILPPGESFGELGVFERSTYCDMATAVGSVTTAAVPIQMIEALSARYPAIAAALARLVARRYRGYVLLTRDLSLKTLSGRLAQSLLRLALSLGTQQLYRGQQVNVLGPFVTQTDLGLMARGSRGNVNRMLKAWEREGWIAIDDRCILILNKARLRRLAIEDE